MFSSFSMFNPFQRRKCFCSFIKLTPSDLFKSFFPLLGTLTPCYVHSPPPALLFRHCLHVLHWHLPMLLICCFRPPPPFSLPFFQYSSLRVPCRFPFLNFNPLRSDFCCYHLLQTSLGHPSCNLEIQ